MRKFRKNVRLILLILLGIFTCWRWLIGYGMVFWVSFVLFLGYLTYALIDENHSAVHDFLKARRKSTYMNEKEIIRINFRMTVAYVLFFVALVAISSLFHVEGIGTCARFVLKYLLLGIFWLCTVVEMLYQMLVLGRNTNEIRPDRMYNQYIGDIANQSLLSRIIVITFACIFIAVIIFICMKSLIQWISSWKFKREEEIYNILAPGDYVVIDERKRSKGEGLREKQSVRRVYKKGIQNILGKDGVPVSSTPAEQREFANRKGFFITEEAIATYEKARYTHEPTTRADIKRMKMLMKEADLSVGKTQPLFPTIKDE